MSSSPQHTSEISIPRIIQGEEKEEGLCLLKDTQINDIGIFYIVQGYLQYMKFFPGYWFCIFFHLLLCIVQSAMKAKPL